MMLMDDQPSGISMGMPPMITGSVAGSDQGRETFQINYAKAGPGPRPTRART